ncbi:MAG: hypothetical protein GYA21_09665 [Myxococcales bacterium]|nr:hypothetical protein [Myxococcales bacterium]
MRTLRAEQALTRQVRPVSCRLLVAERQRAEEEARSLLQATRARAEEERRAILEQAHQESCRERQRILQEATVEATRRISRAACWSAARRARWAEELSLVVEEVCRRILRAEIQAQPGCALRLVRELLEQRLLQQPLVLCLHPRDAARAADILSREPGGQIRVEGREDVEPGGCRLLGAGGEIDASLEVQLGGLLDAVREGLREDLVES